MSARQSYQPGPAQGARIHKEGENWTLVLVRDLRHPPTKVWEAITDPAHLREWAPFDAARGHHHLFYFVVDAVGGGGRSGQSKRDRSGQGGARARPNCLMRVEFLLGHGGSALVETRIIIISTLSKRNHLSRQMRSALSCALTDIYSKRYIRCMESTFSIIAEPSRRAILSLLATAEQSVGDIELQLQLPQPSVSKHLRVLREAGFVESRVDAQRRLYRIRPEPLMEIDAWLAPFRRYWSSHVDALERHLDRMSQAPRRKRKKK